MAKSCAKARCARPPGHRARSCKTLLRKKWIAREDLSDVRDASRTIQIATLKEVEGKLNANQQTIVDYLNVQHGTARDGRSLARAGGSAHDIADAGASAASSSCAKKQASFHMSGMKPRKLEFLFTPAQKAALDDD